MPTSKQVGNDPAVHLTVPAAGKDATPINFHSAETGSGEGSASTSVNQNSLATGTSAKPGTTATITGTADVRVKNPA
jgi:hypothetical protein